VLPDLYEKIWLDLNKQISDLRQTVNTVSVRGNISQTTGGLIPITFAKLPLTNNTGGDLYFVTDGRKSGEGVGAGTGTVVFWNSVTSQWLRITDNTAVVN